MANKSAKGQRTFVTNFEDMSVAFTGDLEIGAVEMKNAATDDRALVAASGGTPTFGLATLPAVANVAAPSLTEAKVAYLSSDLAGNQRVILSNIGTSLAPSAGVVTTQRPSVTQVVSTALEASKVLKASAGQLVQLSVFNSKASAQFILLINATSLPGNGAVTLLYPPIPIAASSLLVIDLPAPLVASTGIVAANSSTGTFSLTVGSADCAFYAQVN